MDFRALVESNGEKRGWEGAEEGGEGKRREAFRNKSGNGGSGQLITDRSTQAIEWNVDIVYCVIGRQHHRKTDLELNLASLVLS